MNISELDRKTSRNYAGWFFAFLFGLHMVLSFMSSVSDPLSSTEMTNSMIVCSMALLATVFLLPVLNIWTLITDGSIDKNFNIGLLVAYLLFVVAAALVDGSQIFLSPSIYLMTVYGPVAAIFEWSTKKPNSTLQ